MCDILSAGRLSIQSGYDICTIEELLGDKSVRTAMIYTYVLNRGGRGVRQSAGRYFVLPIP